MMAKCALVVSSLLMSSSAPLWLLMIMIIAMPCFPQAVDSFCFPPEKRVVATYANRPDKLVPLDTVHVIVGGWESLCVTQALAGILLEEKLGYPVHWVPSKDPAEYWEWLAGIQAFYKEPNYVTAQLKYMGDNPNTIFLEYWPHVSAATNDTLIRSWVQLLGATGTSGRNGWFVPAYVTDEHPEVFSWKSLNQSAVRQLFTCSQYGLCESNKPTFFASSPTYMGTGDTVGLMRNMGLDYYINMTGSDAASVAVLQTFVNHHAPVLFFAYRPQWIFQHIELSRVNLPSNPCDCGMAECYMKQQCDWGIDALGKTASRNTSQDALTFVQQFFINNEIVELVMLDMNLHNKTALDAACDWLKTHENIWAEWVQTPLRYTCPKDCVFGQCVGQTCVCDEGVMGDDCSVRFPKKQNPAYMMPAAVAMAVVLCVLATITLVALSLNRRHPVIVSSSFVFCVIIVTSLFFYAAFGVTFSVNTDATSAFPCFICWVCLAIAFDLNMGSMLIKTWRISRIFRNARMLQTTRIPDSEVLSVLCVIVLYDVLLFALYGALDMPDGERHFESQQEVWKCHSEHGTVWIGLAVAPKVFMLIMGVALAAQVRDLPANFNESMHFGWSIYNTFIMTSFSVAQQLFVKDGSIVCVICVGLVGIGTIVCVFLPKMLRVRENDPAYMMPRKDSDSMKASTTSSKTPSISASVKKPSLVTVVIPASKPDRDASVRGTS